MELDSEIKNKHSERECLTQCLPKVTVRKKKPGLVFISKIATIDFSQFG